MDTTASETTEAGITISDSAVRRLMELTAEGEFKGMFMRVSVSGGGCSGFQYAFSFDDATGADDHVITRDGVTVLVDDVSWEFLVGSELHFAEELIGSFFTLRNPNAASTCGCGTSFSIG